MAIIVLKPDNEVIQICYYFDTVLDILVTLNNHINFRIILSVSAKQLTGILIGIALKL